ncbi:2-oxoacid:ferredoxin oxidoreductase subunit beta [Geodia barretti]|uniref:2-oxoacid:ferredoxin oxidoreductase subunit beta n=1 Tax=Geodia barretti TaxID=519541 RepID=A0AA35T0J4_GEOBA|nr:2-oxoacid:ferredoxin oxidoreductase subunit beta [Geodia barretti]
MTTTESNPGDVGAVALTARDFKGAVDPDWCPGCGDFGVLNSLQRAVAGLGLQPHQILTVSGIGCSSNLPGYINTNGMHTLHGRSLAVATGAKLANHELTVVVTGGDGDGYGIGGNHFTHTARRNIDLTYIVMNNQIYGLTTGQISPTSRDGMKTKSTPFGSVETPINPITSAIMNGASFVARGYSGDVRHLTSLMEQAIQHKGFALVDVFSPCVTFNLDNTHNFFKDRVVKLEDEEHDTSDWKLACEKAMAWGDTIYTGVFFQVPDAPVLNRREPVLDDGGPLAFRKLGLSEDQAQGIIRRMM